MLCVACPVLSFYQCTFLPCLTVYFYFILSFSVHPIVNACVCLGCILSPPFPSLILLHCMDVHMHACVSLPYPPFFSWVISLSYVCPSLCVCVLPSFVSDSFSREIRDAYFVPLFPRSAKAQFHCAAMVSS